MFCHHNRDYRHHWRSGPSFSDWERQLRRWQRDWQRHADRWRSADHQNPERRGARRAVAAIGFWVHFMVYVSVI